ncbi:MAG: type II toxin-antitoxin system HicA family toxin [Verrucomicrobiales bacterium]|nr:type II toxin-antitoxin system HicA family toxin [Verrucomicrobiales bacterium]
MKLPRDVSGRQLGRALGKLGYNFTRPKGSHMRYTTPRRGQHHVTIPDHSPLKAGTLHGILKDVAAHHGLSVEELVLHLEL